MVGVWARLKTNHTSDATSRSPDHTSDAASCASPEIDSTTPPAFDPIAYQADLHGLFELRRGVESRGLEGMRALWDTLGRPAEGIPCIQVAGTNGKGSVCAWLSSIFCASGVRVGLFTSPHLVHFRERFRINEIDVSDERIAHHLPRVLQAANKTGYPPLFFEIVTALGLCLFAEAQVEWMILEVGLGGRLDATTVFPTVASVITSIGLDHCAWLGDTHAAIAREKAGIFRPNVPAWIGDVPEEAAVIIRQEALSHQVSALRWAGVDFSVQPLAVQPCATESLCFVGEGEAIEGLSIPLRGQHQHRNLALALAVALGQREQGWHITKEALRQGVQRVRWVGRLQRLEWRERVVWLDGAHNPEAAVVLAEALVSIRPAVLIFGAMQDKDIHATLRPLLGCVRHTIYCAAHNPRAWSASALQQMAREIDLSRTSEVSDNLADALTKAHAQSQKGDAIVLAGSLYLVGEALRLLDASCSPLPHTA